MRFLRRARTPIQIVFGLVAVGFLAWIVVSNWQQFVSVLASMNGTVVAGAVVLAFIGTLLNMFSWKSILHSFGHDVGALQAGRVTFTAQIGKYIPGGVWPMVAGSQLGAGLGIAGTTMVVTMTLQLGISLIAGGVVAIGSLVFVPTLAEQYAWLVVLILLAGCVVLLPPVMSRLLTLLFRLIRRSDLIPQLRGRHLGAAIAWAVAAWLAMGLQFYLLIVAVDGWSLDTLVPAVSGYALAWLVGFLAVIAPAGAGVREAVLVALFAGMLGTATIFGIALVSRMIFVVVDVALFAIAVGPWWRRR
jgi:glycosyltransferase 2 family protein